MLILTHLAGFGAAPPASTGGALSVSYVTRADSITTASSYTLAATAIGAAASDRYVLVGITVGNSSSASAAVSTVTVGGVSATELTTQLGFSGSVNVSTSFWLAAVSTGTTADVVVTPAATQILCRIGIWRLIGLSSTTPVDTAGSTSSTANLNVDTSAGGAVFSIARNTLSSTHAHTGTTEDFDNIETTFSTSFTGGHASGVISASPRTVTITATGGTFPCSCAVSMR